MKLYSGSAHALRRGVCVCGGGGGGGVSSRVHEQQFSVSRVTKQIVYLISAMSRLGDLCPAITSLG